LAFIEYANDERILDEIKKASNLVLSSIKEKKLEKSLIKAKNIEERNSIV